MIVRIWRGWTTPANAAAYENILRDEVFPGIRARGIAGFRDITLGRRDLGDEVEFVTIMRFDSIADVIAFAGEEYTKAVVPPHARAVLSRFDAESAHYETALSS
jgi:antibiotic biosynthesis monooxygenase (ABM) superfamily enzyme